MKPRAIDIAQALTDPNLLGAALGDAQSWATWLIVLRAAFGLPLSDQQREVFISVAGQREPPNKRVRELWALVARRGGKSRVAAALAVYCALFAKHKLSRGERPLVLVLAASIEQAKTVFSYALSFLTESPVLRQEIVDVTRAEIRLKNNVVIAVHANSFRSVRGRTLCAAILDEVSFWRDETSATPDTEVYSAILPSLATTNGMLIGISTPYRRAGLLYEKYRDHFGVDTDDVLVVQGASRIFNPSLDEAVIAAQRAADPVAALAEWDAEFRTDISAFLDDQTIEQAVDYSRPLELPPQSGISYVAFTDPSGGRADCYTLAIGHRDGHRCIIDLVRGKHVPPGATSFDPQAATQEFADLVKQYHLTQVTGDNFSAEWAASSWLNCGITYRRSELPKSQIYLETLAAFTRDKCHCRITRAYSENSVCWNVTRIALAETLLIMVAPAKTITATPFAVACICWPATTSTWTCGERPGATRPTILTAPVPGTQCV